MRNLKNIQLEHWKPNLDDFFSSSSLDVTAAAWDLANDAIVCTIGPAGQNADIQLVRVKFGPNKGEYKPTILKFISSSDLYTEENAHLKGVDKVSSLHYFADSLTICLVLASGAIVVHREEPLPGEERTEIVGSVDASITAARWSPDEELLAITTEANTLIFMSRGFEGIMDLAMTSDDLMASTHVSVGWGKKETQFKGKGAKALRDPTMPEKIDEGILSKFDDFEANMSWRGDGAFLAISTVEGGSRRLIRVYSREGELASVSEPVDGLEGSLSWRPSGNLITGIQRLDSHVDVIFFERNGLRHGQFSLRLASEQLNLPIRLAWNSDSSILAVTIADQTQLWSMENYHWYLKQEIKIPGGFNGLGSILWHPEKPLSLLTVTNDTIVYFEYILVTVRGSTRNSKDESVVAVIDGHSVKITPFQIANIPPPMSLYEISADSNIIDIAFNSDSTLIAILHQDAIMIFAWNNWVPEIPASSLEATFKLQSDGLTDSSYQQICFESESRVSVLQRLHDRHVIKSYKYESQKIAEEIGGELSFPPTISILSTILDTLQSGGRGDSLEPPPEYITHQFIQHYSGELQWTTEDNERYPSTLLSFPIHLPWIEVKRVNENFTVFGLSANGHLYAGSRLLAKNCTSFLVTPAHLVFTTTTHLLKFVHILTEEFDIPPDNPEADERCRMIERGSRLVVAMPAALSVILQMPRGNLETIYPRAMVLAGIRELVDQKKYRKAFLHCRTQRVDMNILYDHAPEQFLSNITLFLNQVKKISYIDLFLSSLREEDVTQTMYKNTRAIPPSQAYGNLPSSGTTEGHSKLQHSKINKICDAFLEVLKTRHTTNLQNVITANVCKSPPALEDGLLVVAELMKKDESMAGKAVEHICFLADVNKLYDNALGLYDLDLALLVAQQSQKDPREYLPFLQKLQEMSELRRQFSIDDYLHRYTKALNHLHSLDSFSEVQIYVQKHLLYQSALTLYRYVPTNLAIITTLYAEYLESKSSFKEAALAFESLHDYSKAASCYLSSGPSQWRETLFCALSQSPQLEGEALIQLATSLMDALIETKDYFAAATIQLDYLSSVEEAVKLFCRGYFFADALHLVATKKQPELLESVIDTGLADALASSTELLAECRAQLAAQVPRLRELRAKALADPLAFYEGERGGDGEVPDDISVAASSRLSTNRSLFTRYTGRDSQGGSLGTAGTGVSRATSKNRKREERKRARGKKGTIYEEEYLIASVSRLITRVESVRDEVGRLVLALVRRGMWERARAIEASLADVVSMCSVCIPEVFGAEGATIQTEERSEGKDRLVGGDAVLQESVAAAGRPKEPPRIAAFERLALLGA